MRHTTRTRFLRTSLLASAVATSTAGAALVWSPAAFADAGCTTTTTSDTEVVVTCTSAGTDTITIPEGTQTATVVVIGGGGGSGGSDTGDRPSGFGGNGAKVSAVLNVASLNNVEVKVGDGGVGGKQTGGTNILSGAGGQYSGIRLNGTVVVIAGGGGGGGTHPDPGNTDPDTLPTNSSAGGSGAASNTAEGGNGQQVYNLSSPREAPGGEGGNRDSTAPGSGGSAGSGSGTNRSGSAGGDWSDGGSGWPSEGRGARNYDSGGYGGGGGGGYGGGGAGGIGDSLNDGGGGGGAGGSFVDLSVGSEVSYEALSASPGDTTAGAGGASVSNALGNAGQSGSITITFTIVITPATPGSSPEQAAREVTLDFALPENMQCDFGSVEASLGSWIQLPAASDCSITPRAGGEEPSLLGWATREDFPAAIAQRQVDNGWGAYETFNDDGQLTGVFIPAGGHTTVSNDTNLYPIWSE